MAQKLFTGSVVTVASAGTAEQIDSTQIPVTSIFIEASDTNTGNIYIGDSTVSSSDGIPLAAGQSLSLGSDMIPRQADELYLSDLYIDADTNGNEARISYIKRR